MGSQPQPPHRMIRKLALGLLLLPYNIARPQGDCDPIFDETCTPCDEIFGCGEDPPEPTYPTDIDCFDSQNEIDGAIFSGDTRQAFNDCDKQKKCEDYAEFGYACAPNWTCQNSTIITDGKGLIDVRQADNFCARRGGTIDVSDTKCDKSEYVCCKKPNFRKELCPLDIAPNYAECGRTGTVFKVTGEAQERNKNSAEPGEFPHMCVVYKMEGEKRAYVAGASLIARNKVITVAHKIHVIKTGESVDDRDEASKFAVRCGEHNVKTEEELLDSQESRVAEIIFHPQYNPKNVKNNLVILRTEQNFIYQQHIGPVCLPPLIRAFDNQR
eukprot:TRINITY_DN3503_c0_g1_i4.p1 TRINITY_DN3503_c0_g1~~TRINITY_DN3503_c0_g1_i4.p1  ORF type:complete len:327 (-),score=86.41 TRINITY_DN3503_c0_g1_i4:652-1632(-)